MAMIKDSSMVYPSSKTPNHTITLPTLDTILRSPFSHTPLVFIYKNNSLPKTLKPNALKSSLSDALVPFYPLAGRLFTNPKTNHLEITCNAKGVVFIEAETTNTLGDFGEFTPSDALMAVAFPPAWDYSKGLSSVPILGVQVTRFKCGGVMIGLKAHHSVQDGVSLAHFLSSWSRLVRGITGVGVRPCHDRVGCVGPRSPPKVLFRHHEYESLPLSTVGLLGYANEVEIFGRNREGLRLKDVEVKLTFIGYPITPREI